MRVSHRTLSAFAIARTRPASWTGHDQKGAFPEDGTTTVYVIPIPDIHAVREADTFFFSIRVPFPGRGARRHRRRVWRRRDVSAFRQYPRVRRRGRFRDTSGGVVQDN